MMNERTYFKLMFIASIALTAVAVFSFIALFIAGYLGKTDLLNNIFEMIYMGIHIVILSTVTALCYKAMISEKSLVLATLMYGQESGRKSKPAHIIALVFASVGLLAFVYALLVIVGVNLPNFNFPLGLNLDILNVGLTLLIIGLFFFFYSKIKGETNR